MKILKSNIIWFLLLFAVGMTSCEKDEIKDGGGKTLIKIKDGGGDPVIRAIDVNPPTELIRIADIRKDPATEADANAATTITITNSQATLDSVNAANGTDYELLPTAAYTITAASGVTVSGNTWTINLAPGELAREIYINLDKTRLDFSKSYAFGLKITSSTVGSPSSGSGTYIINVIVKNKYDGRYELTFKNYHPTSNPGYTGDVVEVEMHTTGATSVKIYWPDASGYYNPAVLGGNLTAFGAQEPNYTVNETTNAVTVQNSYPGAVTFYTMAAGYNSIYIPATKTFDVKWGYNYLPGGVFDPANTREWTQQFVYLGPR
ncbi:MAG TPA: DUF1735 domain-containing protein [Chitinophagaceae bacterium]|nr:DUF1735 domain-containing protein [Chitinophagaceae bacterium]